MKILRSKGKTLHTSNSPYKDLEVLAIEEVRKQSPIGVVIKVITIGSDWQSKYKEAIGMLLPVERIETLTSTKYFIVGAYHKWYGHWPKKYVKEV